MRFLVKNGHVHVYDIFYWERMNKKCTLHLFIQELNFSVQFHGIPSSRHASMDANMVSKSKSGPPVGRKKINQVENCRTQFICKRLHQIT